MESSQPIEPTTNLHDLIQQEIDDTTRELREIKLMLDQSQVEVDKLSQRNATINIHLQQVGSKINELPIHEIKTAYDAALDAQQRLVGMRGQLEKLQSDQSHLNRYLGLLRRVMSALSGDSEAGLGGNGTEGTNLAKAEMLIQAQETERKRLSRQMHDGPAQALSNFILQTEIAMRLFEVDQTRAREELNSLKNSASRTFQHIRDFIFDLRPMMLDDLGLLPTIKQYSNSFREKHNVDVIVSLSGTERRLESYLEVLVFRAVQELLNYAATVSQATQIKLQLDMMEGIKLVVEDNGTGFVPESLEKQEDAFGMNVIRERVVMLNGNMEVDSVPGQGARIQIQIPILGLPA